MEASSKKLSTSICPINIINRSELIAQLSARFSLEPADAESITRVIFEALAHALIQGNRIEIRGFGSFELRFRPKRRARNPKTGVWIETKAKYSIHFKPGKEMRERVNQSAAAVPQNTHKLTEPLDHQFSLHWKSKETGPQLPFISTNWLPPSHKPSSN